LRQPTNHNRLPRDYLKKLAKILFEELNIRNYMG
jgi:hypothetical protein